MKQKFKLLSTVMFVGIAMATVVNAQNITGASTTNYVLKFTNTSGTVPTAGNSLIFDNGTNVSIGLAGAGSYKLDVSGDINIASGSAYKMAGSNALVQLFNTGNPSSLHIGVGAGVSSTYTNIQNTMVGSNAGHYTNNASNAGNNTFIGFEAGYNNIHDENTFIGSQAGLTNTSGEDNSFVGHCSGKSNDGGSYNTALGHWAGAANANGSYNVAVGAYSLYFQDGGANNTVLGYKAAYGVISNGFSNNSIFGYEAGYGITSGGNNVFMGYKAGYTNTSGDRNTFLGDSAGYANSTGTLNTFLGGASGYNNTTASSNAFLGYHAGYTNTTGYNNVTTGRTSLYSNSTGYDNIATGVSALYSNTTGVANNGIGLVTLYHNTTGSFNVANGMFSMYSNSTGGYNTASGYAALYSTTADDNVSYGYNAGYANTSGSYNTFIGTGAGQTYSTGGDNTFLGYGSDANANSYTFATAIGDAAIVLGSSRIQLGNTTTDVYQTNGHYYTSDGRFKTNVTENVKGLAFINKLRPVTYNMDTKALDDFIIKNMPDSIKTKHQARIDFAPSTAKIHSGFIAQEVEATAQQVGFSSTIVSSPSNSDEPYALNYAEIVVPLVKAVQELSKKADSLQTQDSTNLAIQKVQQKKIDSQDSINIYLQNEINQLTGIINTCCSNGTKIGNNNTPNGNTNNTSGTQTTTATNVTLNNAQTIVLEQNVPNPFAEQTTINYSLPDNTGKAQMLFYNSDGKLIQSVELTQKGQGQLNVFASDLSSGIYTYTLVVDGKIVETKKMLKQ